MVYASKKRKMSKSQASEPLFPEEVLVRKPSYRVKRLSSSKVKLSLQTACRPATLSTDFKEINTFSWDITRDLYRQFLIP